MLPTHTTATEVLIKQEQAGAELCQAQASLDLLALTLFYFILHKINNKIKVQSVQLGKTLG